MFQGFAMAGFSTECEKKTYFQLYHGFANIFPENIMIGGFPNDIYIYIQTTTM